MDENELEKVYNFLISKGTIDKKNVDDAYDESKANGLDVFDVIVGKKLLTEEDMTKLKAEYLGLPYVDIKDKAVGREVLKIVPEKSAIFYKFMPFEKENNVVKFAMVDPNNIEAYEALKFIALRGGILMDVHLASKGGFNNAVKQYRTFNEELKDVLRDVDKRIVGSEKDQEKKVEKSKDVMKIIEEAPVSRIVDIIISHAIEGKASDIHVEQSENELRVRYRLDGILHDSLILPSKVGPAVVSRIKILADLKIDETRKPQDGRIRFEVTDRDGYEKSIDLRVSTLPTVNGEKVVMRILDTSSDIGSLESLGIQKRGLNIIKQNIDKPFGIILITGPTGSGKSTTLYAILKILNKEGVNIITLEDPVEYHIKGVNQSQIQSEIGYSFASGLRAILRQDPNIIMVGEIRDKETAELATHAALTGHLVLSTLHTNNAAGVIPRLIDMGIEPFLISSSLNVAVAQRLVRKICKYCRKEVKPTPAVRDIIERELKAIPSEQKKDLNLNEGIKLYKGAGCRECKQSGTSGRIGIYEVLSMTPELEDVMSSKITDTQISVEAKRQGMITMMQDGIMKVLQGVTTIEEVLRVTEE